MDDTRLGPLLLEGKVVKEEDLERCLEIQALTGNSRPLGQILVEQDLISARELDELLELQRRRREPAEAADFGDMSTEAPQEYGCQRFLEMAANLDASELILSEGRCPTARVGGRLQLLDREPLQSPEVWMFIRDHLGDQALEQLAEQKSLTTDFHCPGLARGRLMVFRQFNGACVVLRLLSELVRPQLQAGLGPTVREALKADKGLILLTGEIGSGITSTMASMLADVVQHDRRLVVVLEEATEYELPKNNSVVVRRRVGASTVDYEAALESAVRMNPDVIALSDASSPATFDMALRAAEDGRLVIAALPARTVCAALQRIIDFYHDYDIQRVRSTLASVVRCILRLQLVPGSNGTERALATELLNIDPAAAAVLREGTLQHLEVLMDLDGTTGHTMDADLVRLQEQGKANYEDCFHVADSKSRMLKHQRARRPVAAS